MKTIYTITVSALLFTFLVYCKKQLKAENIHAPKIAVVKEPSSIENIRIADNGPVVALPFDFEEYTSLCIQQSVEDCSKRYPSIAETESTDLMGKLSAQMEGTPERIFKLNSSFKNDLKVYIIFFDGDSSSQELITVMGNKVIASQSVGYAMPENQTYESFKVNEDMTVDIYEINYETLKKKNAGKYKILADGKIIKSK